MVNNEQYANIYMLDVNEFQGKKIKTRKRETECSLGSHLYKLVKEVFYNGATIEQRSKQSF